MKLETKSLTEKSGLKFEALFYAWGSQENPGRSIYLSELQFSDMQHV